MLFRSLTLWLMVMLILADLTMAANNPFQYLPKKFRPISNDSWVSKFPIFFHSYQNPDVFILGSSLPMAGFSLTNLDLQHLEGEAKNERLRTSLQCSDFASMLRVNKIVKGGGSCSNSVVNLSCAGCMISDSFHLMEKADLNKTLPKIVFIGIAPRDFSDNWIPAIGQTPLWQVVDEWDVFSCKQFSELSIVSSINAFFKRTSSLYRMHKDLKFCLQTIFEMLMKHPSEFVKAWECKPTHDNSRDISTCQNLEQPTKEAVLKKDLQVYKARYNPPNPARFGMERNYLEKLIALCSKDHIYLIVIDMPLTVQNKKLLSSESSGMYEKIIRDLKTDSRLFLIQCNEGNNFLDTDFSDSSHLNLVGARKFQKFIVDRLGHGQTKFVSQVGE